MKIVINLLISLIAFAIAISIAYATGIELVFRAVFLAFAIQWIAFIPAYIFQTEKFYDLTGSLTYLSVIWYSLAYSSEYFQSQSSKFSDSTFNNFLGIKTWLFYL